MKAILIDDEFVHVRGMTQFIHWEQLGYEPPAGYIDAREALSAIESGSFDAVITDIKMPGLDGLSLIRKIHEANKQAYIIIVSGYGEFQYAQEAIALGVRAFLLKPLDVAALESELQKCRHLKIDQDHERILKLMNKNETPAVSDIHPVIREAMQYITEHYADNLSAQMLASKYQMNASYFGTLFKRETNITINAYIHGCRLTRAFEMLKDPTERINEVAYKCGYSRAAYFSEQFKSYFGFTPTQMRSLATTGEEGGL